MTTTSHDGRSYNDDRLFILDLVRAKTGTGETWAVVTRRNCEGLPPFRVDDCKSESDAIAFIKRLEPTTPLVSLRGRSPAVPLRYDEYCLWLKAQGVTSSLDLYEANKGRHREIIVEDVDPRVLDDER